LQGNSTLFTPRNINLITIQEKNQKTPKRKITGSTEINNTNTKERLFSDSFTIEELEEAINKTKPKKQAGSDKILPEFT
jgi:hypothetical protein